MVTIHHRLLISASEKIVYEALTQQQNLEKWWTPKAIVNAEEGIIKFHFGENYYKEMKIAMLKPYESVSWICTKAAEEWIGTTISFNIITDKKENVSTQHPEMQGQAEQLNQNAVVALLEFTQSGWKDTTPMFSECSYTWALFLRSLKLYCETGKGTPWPEQHHV